MVRIIQIAILCGLVLVPGGCQEREETHQVWDDVKIGNLASPEGTGTGNGAKESAEFEMHVLEVPADNASKLNGLWPMLSGKPLKFKNREFFSNNGFSAGFGRVSQWQEILHLVDQAGGHRAIKLALLLDHRQAEILPITTLGVRQKVYQSSENDKVEGILVGPGMFGLRVISVRPGGMRGAADVLMYPLVRSIMQPLPHPNARAVTAEHDFLDAAIRVRMSPGDLIVIGPRKELKYWSTLGGLTFSKPEGSMFLEKGKRPIVRPATRLFVLVCTRVGY